MTSNEAYALTGNFEKTNGVRNIGAHYWLASASDASNAYAYDVVIVYPDRCYGRV